MVDWDKKTFLAIIKYALSLDTPCIQFLLISGGVHPIKHTVGIKTYSRNKRKVYY
jgi:hypothetical protein